MTSLPGHVGWPITGDKTLEFARNPIEFVQRNINTLNSRIFQVRTLNKPHVFVTSNQGVKEVLEGKALLSDHCQKRSASSTPIL